MDADMKPMSTKELTQAVGALLEQEQRRERKRQRRAIRRQKQRRDQTAAHLEQLTKSVVIIQRCVIGITSVMTVAVLIVVIVIWQIGSEAQRIKGEIQTMQSKIEREAEAIREKITHPLQTLGGNLGGKLDAELKDLIQGNAK